MAERYWQDYQQGEARELPFGQDPPTSSLVEAFRDQEVQASDAIVLRGYLGRSDILQRAIDYMLRAERNLRALRPDAAVVEEEIRDEVTAAGRAQGLDPPQAQALADAMVNALGDARIDRRITAAFDAARNAGLGRRVARQLAENIVNEQAVTNAAAIRGLITRLRNVEALAQPHIPWRLYLTPRLDSYVDFHRSALLAFRREAQAARQDACTIWLRAFEDEGRRPIPYRLVYENLIGPTYATWLSGQLVDDDVAEASTSTAWGDQSALYGGFRPGSFKTCLGS